MSTTCQFPSICVNSSSDIPSDEVLPLSLIPKISASDEDEDIDEFEDDDFDDDFDDEFEDDFDDEFDDDFDDEDDDEDDAEFAPNEVEGDE